MTHYVKTSIILLAVVLTASTLCAGKIEQCDDFQPGEMTERLKVHAWKACVRETVPRVRIPLSPPLKNCRTSGFFILFLCRTADAGSCAMGACEPGQVRKEAALSGYFHVPQGCPVFTALQGSKWTQTVLAVCVFLYPKAG